MGTAIQGLNRAFLRSISSLGADVLHVSRQSWFIRSYSEWVKVRNRRDITLSQVKQLEEQLTLARAVAPVAEWRAPVRYKNRQSQRVIFIGTTEEFLFTSGVNVAQGRFLLDSESAGGRPVCVIGTQVASNLFLNDTPLGKTIRSGEFPFEVVGVLEPQGTFLGEFSLDNQVIIPVKQFMACFLSSPSFRIQVKAISLEQLDEAKEEVRGVMRKLRRVAPGEDDDFAINQQETFINTFNRVAGTIAAVGLFITGLSLFVGGIGIMNIMFVSVAERTPEIGIRKAIGARRRTILLQFLIESAGICVLGGLVGLGIAFPLTFLINKFLPATMSWTAAGIALVVALVTGIASGFFPAWRAARMNPVDALRNE
jgi:putative ABC transport system permease protein